jgi:hypothetical protein
MSTSCKVGTFNIPASDATTIQIRGLGFEPWAVIFFSAGRTEATDTAGRASHDRTIGWATRNGNMCYAATQSTDAVNPSQTDESINTNGCIVTLTHAATGAVDGRATYTTNADGFDVVIPDTFSHAIRVSWFALCGDSITDATCGTFLDNASAPANFDITTVGFLPSFMMLASNDRASGGTQGNSELCVGAAVSSTKYFCVLNNSEDALATIVSSSYALDIECGARFEGGGLGVNARKEFVEFLSNGFRLNQLESNYAMFNIYLAIKGGSYDVGSFLTKTDTTDISVTTGFKPSGVLLLSHNQAESTQNTRQAIDQWSMGAFISVTERVAHAIRDNNGTTGSETSTAIEYDEAYINLDSAGAVQGLMDVKSVDSGGFTMVMDDTDPSAAFVGYIAFGPSAQTPDDPYLGMRSVIRAPMFGGAG